MLLHRLPPHPPAGWARLASTLARGRARGSTRRTVFPVLQTHFDPTSEQSGRNRTANFEMADRVRATRAEILASDRATSSREREGRKLTIHERIDLLVDEDSEPLELGMLAGFKMPYGTVYNASQVIAIATVCGVECVLSGTDWTFKGGTMYPISVKKQLRAQEISMRNRLPLVYFVDTGGAFLPLQSEVFPGKEHGGRVFRNQAILSAAGIPQVAVVCGPCTAGGAYNPMMADEAVIVEEIGTMYLGGPPLVKAATGETIGPQALGGAAVHCGISGCTDHFAGSEEEAADITRAIVASFNQPAPSAADRLKSEPPLYGCSEEDFARLVPAQEEEEWPMLELIARVTDGSQFHTFKERFGETLHTGFARLGGHLVGILASAGPLTAPAAVKGGHFVRLCSVRGVPLLFLQNTPSDSAFLSPTGNDGATAKARAQMMAAVATSSSPKITVVMGGGYGPSSIAMGGRGMQPNFHFCWPQARMGVASPEHLREWGGGEEEEEEGWRREEREFAASNLVTDGVILPHETREVVSRCLSACLVHHQTPSSHPLSVLRM